MTTTAEVFELHFMTKTMVRFTGGVVLAAAMLFAASTSAGCWVDTYWPLQPGDCRTFLYQSTKELTICVTSAGFNEYKVSSSSEEDEAYEIHRLEGGEVLLPEAGVEWGWRWITVSFDPPVVLLDDQLLMNGGSRITHTTATQAGVDPYPATFTVKVQMAGPVTVPAGTFHNCRSVTVSEKATIPGYGTMNTPSFMTIVIAPQAGIVKKLVEPGVWAHLTGGSVGGIDVTQLAGPAVPLPPSISMQPRSLSVTHGAKATFSVTAQGSARLQYQWLKDGQPVQNDSRISGAQTATLAINRTRLADKGQYSVSIGNAACVVLSTNASLNVTADVPKVAMTSPVSGLSVSSNLVTVRGTATDDWGLSEVSVRVNSGAFVPASTTNNWTNWMAVVALPNPGTNLLVARAVDWDGLVAYTTNKVRYVESDPLALQISPPGGGSVSGVTNHQWMELGRSYKATATANKARGYAFTHWLRTTNGVNWVTSTVPALTFTMHSNLVLLARFVDVQKPTVTITAPTLNHRWSNAVFTVAGKAADNAQVAQVLYQLNTGDWTRAATASNWSNWTANLTLTPGTNVIRAYALDTSGNLAQTVTGRVVYVPTYALVEYFHPISVGNQWVYRWTHGSLTPTNSVIRVESASYPLTCSRGRRAPTSYITNVISLYSSYCDYRNGAEVNIEDTWYEYYTTNGGVRIWGSDDDPGTVPDPDEERLRVDGGALWGERLAVGQTIAATKDFYEDGKFIGAIPVSVQLVAKTSVTVPAGTFLDCLRLRVIHSINGAPTSFEEWWAKGIGMVKKNRTSSGGHPEAYELIEFTLAGPGSAPLVGLQGVAVQGQAGAPVGDDPPSQALLLQLEHDQRDAAVANGWLKMRLTGPVNVRVVLEASSDLVTWRAVSTNTLSAGGLSLSWPMDTDRHQFYRAQLAP